MTDTVTETVWIGVGRVVTCAVTPRHEQALEYLAKLVQALAYAGKLVPPAVTWRFSR